MQRPLRMCEDLRGLLPPTASRTSCEVRTPGIPCAWLPQDSTMPEQACLTAPRPQNRARHIPSRTPRPLQIVKERFLELSRNVLRDFQGKDLGCTSSEHLRAGRFSVLWVCESATQSQRVPRSRSLLKSACQDANWLKAWSGLFLRLLTMSHSLANRIEGCSLSVCLLFWQVSSFLCKCFRKLRRAAAWQHHPFSMGHTHFEVYGIPRALPAREIRTLAAVRLFLLAHVPAVC